MTDRDEKATGTTRTLSPNELANALRAARDARSAPPDSARDENGAPTWGELFHDLDRTEVESIESAIVAGYARSAVVRTAEAVRRLVGAEGADVTVTVLLLGISGTEWIQFQRTARLAHEGGEVTTTAAAECFAFLVDAARRIAAAKSRA